MLLKCDTSKFISWFIRLHHTRWQVIYSCFGNIKWFIDWQWKKGHLHLMIFFFVTRLLFTSKSVLQKLILHGCKVRTHENWKWRRREGDFKGGASLIVFWKFFQLLIFKLFGPHLRPLKIVGTPFLSTFTYMLRRPSLVL